MRRVWSNPPLDIHSAAAWISFPRASSSPQFRCIIKLIFKSTIHLIWKERNMRIFCSRSSSAQMICAAVDRQVRDRLLSIKASP
ncbi:hypothetical protein HID58_035481 [Brassica napus]|uniref:DUF4283 domain-containing protein n=1 Tax=Brassica napus TaxID=3708 RepID=A0ABQ8C6U5_BRANA|nr:hypothetical protein HID58_035481 [Brassica napus]